MSQTLFRYRRDGIGLSGTLLRVGCSCRMICLDSRLSVGVSGAKYSVYPVLTILSQARQKFKLDSAMQSIVHPLVHVNLLPAILFAHLAHLRDLPGHVVADPKPLELAFLVKVVDNLQGSLIWHSPVRCMEVEQIDMICPERF